MRKRRRRYGEALEITKEPVQLKGSVSLDRGGQLEGGLFGVPWWIWLLGTTGTVAVIAWAIASNSEPNPEVEPVSTDDGPSDVPLASIGGGFRLAPDAAWAFTMMRDAASKDGVQLPVSTAYRSRAHQEKLYAAYQAYQAGGPWAPQAAKPGNSKHEVGLALDLTGVDSSNSNFNSARREWLDANAETYGWKNVGMGFRSKEPWHFEFKSTGIA